MQGIGAVVVTYNRLKCLKQALNSFNNQVSPPDYVLVVDNASTDGTGDYLDAWSKESCGSYRRYVLHEPVNCGGSGGFADGLEKAVGYGADWIWLSDDDAYLEPDAFEKAFSFINELDDTEVVAICSSVINNGAIDTAHRRMTTVRGLRVRELQISSRAYEEPFDLNTFSFVGAIIRSNAIRAAGLPLRDYFIWYDDTEYSLRLSELGRIVCVPSIKVTHDVSKTEDAFGWKGYYGQRNCLDMIKRHFSALVYAFSLLRAEGKVMRLRIASAEVGEMYQAAIDDQRKGRLGLHEKYKPGWRPSRGAEPRH